MKGVKRIDQDKFKLHGWRARLTHKGKQYSSFFSDSRYKGKAEQRAIDWYIAKHKEFGTSPTRRTRAISESNTGVVGVYWDEQNSRYRVTWTDAAGKRRATCVKVRTKERAFEKACEKRKAGVSDE